MTATLVQPRREKSFVDLETDLDRLEYLGDLIKEYHERVLTQERHALHDACQGGQFASAAYPLWRALRACGKCKKKWVDWLRTHVGVGKKTIETYKRIHDNWHLLKDLPPEQQSIRAAIRFLDGDKRATPSNEISLKADLLMEMSEKHELSNVSPAKLVAIMNDVLKAAHFRKTVKIG